MRKFYVLILCFLTVINVQCQQNESSKTLLEIKASDYVKSNKVLRFYLKKMISSDLDSGIYEFKRIGKSKYYLIHNLSNKKVQFKAINAPVQPSPHLKCDEQMRLQLAYYQNKIYPKLLERANKNCKAFKHCLTIYCNKEPYLFIMFLISPTNPRCGHPINNIEFQSIP